MEFPRGFTDWAGGSAAMTSDKGAKKMTNNKPSGPSVRGLRSLPCVSLAAALAATMALAGCSSGSSSASSTSSPSASDGTVDESAASLLPAQSKGATLNVAFEVGNLPWSDFTSDKSSYQGLDNDLIQAIASVLGVKVQIQGTSFANEIPGVQGGRYDIAMSNIFDTAARENTVDEVTYATDGQILITKKGGQTGLTADSLCGLKVAAGASTVQASELPTRSQKCVADGKQPIVVQVYPSQGEEYLSVTSGRADVLNTSSSNGDYLIKTRPDDFQQAGPVYENVPIALVMKKSSPITKAVAAAVNVLIKNGTYGKIFDKWGLRNSLLDEAKINPATGK